MAPTIDVSSAEILLVYTGPEDRPLGAAGAPAHDLSLNDIGRLAYRRAIDTLGDSVGRPIDPEDPEAGVITRPDPRQPDPELVEQILLELLESGRYAPVPAPASEAAPAPRARTKGKAEPQAEPPAEPETQARVDDQQPVASGDVDDTTNDETATSAEKPEA